MFKKFTKGLEHIKLFSSQYLTIVTFAGIILGGYKVYDKWNDSIKLVQEKVEIVMKNQESQKKIDSLLLQSQNNLRKEFEEHTKNIDRFEKQLHSLQKSYVRYISNDDALTKQDFLQYMEGLTLEEKKSFIDNNEIDTISSTTTRNAKIIVRKIEK